MKTDLQKQGLLFGSIVFLHAIVWVLLPMFLHPAYRPDVIELMFIGREWVWASAKHPMLPAWLLEITNILTYRSFAAPFIISQLCVVGTLTSVWLMGRASLPSRLAIIPPLMLLPYWFFTVESVKFNQNSTLVFLWTLSILFTYWALKTNKRRFWIGAGIAIGVGFHSKFTMIILVIAILLFMIFDARSRRLLKTWGPYITTFLAIFVFLPQITWMLHHGFPGEKTAVTVADETLVNRIQYPLVFLLENVGYLLPSFIALCPVLMLPWRIRTELPDDDRWTFRFLATMIGIPLAFHLVIAATLPLNLNPEYGLAFWPMIGILLLLRFEPRPNVNFKWFGVLVFFGELLMIGVFIGQAVFSPAMRGTPRAFHFPMRDIGPVCEQIWAKEGNSDPCPYMTGVWWLAGNAAQTMRPTPTVHAFSWTYGMDIDWPLSTWSTDDDVNQRGGLVLWFAEQGIPEKLYQRFPAAELLPEIELKYPTWGDISPVKIGVAIVRPKMNKQRTR